VLAKANIYYTKVQKNPNTLVNTAEPNRQPFPASLAVPALDIQMVPVKASMNLHFKGYSHKNKRYGSLLFLYLLNLSYYGCSN